MGFCRLDACSPPSRWQPLPVSIVITSCYQSTKVCAGRIPVVLKFAPSSLIEAKILSFIQDGGQWKRAFQMLFLLTLLLPPMSLVPPMLLALCLYEN